MNVRSESDVHVCVYVGVRASECVHACVQVTCSSIAHLRIPSIEFSKVVVRERVARLHRVWSCGEAVGGKVRVRECESARVRECDSALERISDWWQ